MEKRSLRALALASALIGAGPAFSQISYSLDAYPGAMFPVMGSAELFNVGASVSLAGHAMFLPWFGAGLGLEYGTTTLKSSGSYPMNLIGVGPSVIGRYEFIPRFSAFASASGGYYVGVLDSMPGDSAYLSAKAGVSYRMAGGFSLGLTGAYSHFFGRTEEPLLTAAGASLSLSFSPQGASTAPKLRFGDVEVESLFPVFYSWYDTNPLGSVMITNGEGRAVESVEVSFYIKDYMDQPKVCASIPRLDAGKSAKVDLKAIFSDKVLGITEGTKVAAEVQATYKDGDEVRRVSKTVTISIYDRNASTWDDDRKAAAFVTARDPLVMRFAKTAATAVNASDIKVFSTNVRIATALFESIRTHGVSYVVDPKSSYADRSAKKGAVDYLQFPRQTLQYKAGDCDDLSIMMCALLESVGIETSFITVPGHIFMAYDTGIVGAEYRMWFSDPATVIVKDGKAWMPVEMTLVKDGFKVAWLRGADEWNEAQAGKGAGFFPVREAWEIYKPVGLPGATDDSDIPAQARMKSAFGSGIAAVVDRESNAFRARIQKDLDKAPDDPRLLNRMGASYARFGQYEKAEEQFEAAIRKKDYGPAIINQGLLSLKLKNPKKALSYFALMQKKDPENPFMLAGMSRAQAQMGNMKASSEALARLKKVSPEFAKKVAAIADSEGFERAGLAGEEEIGWAE